MSLGRLQVNLPKATLSTLKKRAFAEGTSASEIARKVLEAEFDTSHDSAEGTRSKIDSDAMGVILLEAIRKARAEKIEEDATTREVMESLGLAVSSGSERGSGVSPEITRFEVETLAKIESLLRKISIHLSSGNPSEYEDRIKVAEADAAEILKKLKIGGEK